MPAPPPAAPSSSALTGGRPSPAQDGATPLRIRVTDLDSIEQAQLWRRYGPQEAIARVVAMIRSALLLSDEIIVDRNQLLDGIALLALGPDDLRWHLGLPPTARLPIVVSCAPDPQTGQIDVSQQLAAVGSAEFLSAANVAMARSSASPLEWLMPGREAAPSAARDTFSTPWSAEEKQPSGLPAERLRTAREAWGEAMTRGHVRPVRWSPITLRTDLGDARALCAELPVLGELLEIIGERTDRRTALRALDERRDRFTDTECRRAFRWWTERYYDAICDAHDEIRISFSQGSERGGEAQGVRAGLRSRWQMIRTRLSRREIQPRHDVPFEGEIVENMRVISPGDFQQLRHGPTRVHEFWAAPSNRKIWNLAVAVRRSMGRPRVRREKLLAVLATKALLALGVAVILGLRDMQVLPTDTTWWLLFWGALAFVLAFPWGLLLELSSLTSFSMTATLRLGDDRTRPPPLPSSTLPATSPTPAPPAPGSPASAESSQAPWHQVWHAGDFDLAVQRASTGKGRSLHRIVSVSGRAGAVALCRRSSDADGARKTLLVRVHRPAVGADLWELPRGFGDEEDSTPAHTALREYHEETGLTATVRAELGPVFPDSGLLANAVHIVLLEASDNAAPTAPDGEVSDSRWFTEAEINALVEDGQITDGITLAALHRAAVHARNAQAPHREAADTEKQHSHESRSS